VTSCQLKSEFSLTIKLSTRTGSAEPSMRTINTQVAHALVRGEEEILIHCPRFAIMRLINCIADCWDPVHVRLIAML